MSTAETLQKNKQKRGTIRAAITRLIKKIEDELNAGEGSIPENVEDSLAVLSERETALYKLDEIIENQSDVKDLEAEVENSMECSNLIILCKSRANRYLGKRKNNSAELDQSKTETVSSVNVSSTKAGTNTKLPRISLNKFTGDDICKFQEFWPQYKAAIHDNESLQDIEKFNYLKTLLSNSAATSISGLPLTAENYKVAIDILTNRYAKRDVLISAHTNRLLTLEPVRRSNDVAALRNLFDEISVQIRSLESLEVQSDKYGCLLLPILYKCIPPDIILQFNREQIEGQEPSVEQLLKFLKKETEARERNINMTSSKFENAPYEKKPKQTVPKYPPKYKTPSAMTLKAIVETVCPFCREPHTEDECSLEIDKKRELLRKQSKCFRCFLKYHRKSLCRTKNINCSICNSKAHKKSLCPQFHLKSDASKHKPISKTDAPPDHDISVALTHQQKKEPCAYFQTLRCEAVGRNGFINIRLMTDSASERTFVKTSLARQLGLRKVCDESVRIYTFGANNEPENRVLSRVSVLLKDKHSDRTVTVEALEIQNICVSDLISVPSAELNEEMRKLGICLSDTPDESNDRGNDIDLLVGSDFYWTILTGKNKRISPTVVLNETIFGWSLHGKFCDGININSDESVSAMCVSVWDGDGNEGMSKQLERFWQLESIVSKDELTERNLSDKQTLEQFEECIKFKNDRYEVKLPLKSDSPDIPDNYDVAKKRFESLIKRFRNNPALFEDYKAIIEEYISLGIVERVEPREINSNNGNLTYYLPHHPIIHDNKKLRIVFDASSHADSQPSLNNVLHPGPNLNTDLFDLILQFRSNNIALVGDIEMAFLNISLYEGCRDATRFLWVDKIPDDRDSLVEPIILRMTRVLFGVTSSPFLLRAVIKHHTKLFETQYPETCSVINSSMYVDDLVTGAATENEALKIATEARDIFLKANMSLCKWQSNSPLLRESLKSLNFDVCPEPSFSDTPFKVLGLIWDPEKDTFKLDNRSLSEFVNCKEKTKRTIIRAAGRLFDPIGFYSPFTIIIKIIFQSLWERGIDWDQNLPADLEKKWDNWCAQLPHLSEIEIPRFYFCELPNSFENVELHCFSDASERAFGACVYIRFCDNDNVKTTFVTSKSRLAPIKRLTLPRLELMGALIGARLVNRVMSIFKFNISKVYLWSDSNIVIHWIKSSSSNWKPFVNNRVSEIQTLTNPMDWRHCPGRSNPADRLTRGLPLIDLKNDTLWWSGPPWLIEEPVLWPKEAAEISEDMKNEEARQKIISQNICTANSIEPLIKLENFSSILKVIRIVAWIRRFIYNARNSTKKEGCLSAKEIKEAENFLIMQAQLKTYKEEIEALKRKEQIGKNSKIFTLCPYLDEHNLLRIGSRLSQAELSPNEINPIILPKNEKFTELMTMREHQNLMHSGVSLTLTKIRRRFWIPQGRQLVKKVINKCLICRKYSAKPANQLTGQLPRDRITESHPFCVIGLDFAGPVYIRTETNNTSKSYIVLFTCATTRAVHLELTTNMSTKSFIMAFRRFLSRRGACKIIYSDNARVFKAADRELQNFTDILKNSELQDFISSQGVTWKFIVEHTPWWGGFYERMVKCVKDPLRKILGKARLTFEELTTIITEIESIVNMRPLTYTPNEIGEPEPLTPAHFLQFGRSEFNYPLHFVELENKLSTKETLTRRKTYQTKLLKQLWAKWKDQYLLTLNSAHKFKTPKKYPNLQIGDVVLVDGIHKSKLLWDLGIITQVIIGRDKLIRACVVKTPRGVFRKPVQQLYPFELDNN